MTRVLNVAAYRFVDLDPLQPLREQLEASATRRMLRGTILLAPEGLNLFLAGVADDVRGFLDELAQDSRFRQLPVRESWSDDVPFKRLRVRLKREIIRMDTPEVRPVSERAPSVDAQTLSRWLDAGHDDAGRPILMLDTRNAFEVESGAFAGAVDWQLRRFGDFPQALRSHGPSLAGHTVVTYCTGGIRCEKAAWLMRSAGIPNALQLDGGILGYLEKTDGRHWLGDCVVFDDRGAVDSALRPRATALPG